MRFTLMALSVLCACISVSLLYAQSDPEYQRPMTSYDIEMSKVPDIGRLQFMWDTLSNNHDRRYFLKGLPGYCRDRKENNYPAWISRAIEMSLKSNDPNLVREAVLLAGEFKLNYGNQLMDLYPSIRGRFNSHYEALQSAIVYSVSGMPSSRKDAFYYSILVNERPDVMGATYESLLYAIDSAPQGKYAQQLEAYSTQVDAMMKTLQDVPVDKKRDFRSFLEIKEKTNRAIKKCKEK
jgi:hypothetical protein